MLHCLKTVNKILSSEAKADNAICLCRTHQQKMHIWLLSRHISATGVAMIQPFSFCGQYMELTCCKRADMLAKPSLPKMHLLTKAVYQKIVKRLCQCRSKTACCTDTTQHQIRIRVTWPCLWVILYTPAGDLCTEYQIPVHQCHATIRCISCCKTCKTWCGARHGHTKDCETVYLHVSSE